MDKDPEETPPLSESPPPRLKATALTSFFTLASASCACCNEKLHGAILQCRACDEDMHDMCPLNGQCISSVCGVYESPLAGIMRTCGECPWRLEAPCHVCSAPKTVPPSPRPKVQRFKEEWCLGCPLLRHENGHMWCLPRMPSGCAFIMGRWKPTPTAFHREGPH